jgi:hypothetical protein
MFHEQILRKYFTINKAPKGWTSLETLSGEQLPGFKTRRVAKSETGDSLYFTIGETEKGKQAGLDRTIENIIAAAGLQVLSLPSTNGNRTDKIYKGFDLRQVSSTKLETILKGVQSSLESLS